MKNFRFLAPVGLFIGFIISGFMNYKTKRQRLGQVANSLLMACVVSYFIGILWEGLEIRAYGTIQHRSVDDVIFVILIIVLFCLFLSFQMIAELSIPQWQEKVNRSINKKGEIRINGTLIHMEDLKSQKQLLQFFESGAPTHTELMEFCEEYMVKYQNPLYWIYPISDGVHMGEMLVLVKEGILSIPYDNIINGEECFDLDQIRRFTTREEIQAFLTDWISFSNDLTHAMQSMSEYIEMNFTEESDQDE